MIDNFNIEDDSLIVSKPVKLSLFIYCIWVLDSLIERMIFTFFLYNKKKGIGETWTKRQIETLDEEWGELEPSKQEAAWLYLAKRTTDDDDRVLVVPFLQPVPNPAPAPAPALSNMYLTFPNHYVTIITKFVNIILFR